MKTRIDERLRVEARKYRLQFTCGHCAHFDHEHSRCAEGYPNEEHTDSSLEGDELLFCKLFEGA